MNNTAYGSFAYYYDQFMDNIPYDEWTEYLDGLLKEQGVKDGLVLELGCGTGSVTRRLKKLGYDMIGLDISEEMLEIALNRENDGILYLHQDMRGFELYGTVAAVVSVCDTMNYITEPEDLTEVFRLVNNYLDPGGCFVFDLKTRHYYQTELAENVFAENREDYSLIWENYYDETTCLNEYDLTIYAEQGDGLYQRYEETHCQRAWSLDEIQESIEASGMEFVTAYDAFTKDAVRPDSERIYVIAREKYQEKKLYI